MVYTLNPSGGVRMVTDEIGTGVEGECSEVDGLDLCACLIRERGLKATSQRIRILCYLKAVEDHPTVDQIHSALREEEPSLSKTTVYNTLDLFRKEGLVSVLTIQPSEQRYEYGRDMHHHLWCDECGRIHNIEIRCPYIDGLLHGKHKIKEVHGYFRGTCNHCLTAVPDDEEMEE
jgi:Fe2+ or Zn2+ uptake regulation protein